MTQRSRFPSEVSSVRPVDRPSNPEGDVLRIADHERSALAHRDYNQEASSSVTSPKEALWAFAEKMRSNGTKRQSDILNAYRQKNHEFAELNQYEKMLYLQKIASVGKNMDSVHCYPESPKGTDSHAWSRWSRVPTDQFLARFNDGVFQDGKKVSFYKVKANSAGTDVENYQSRLSLGIVPSHAPAVFDYVVTELVAKDANVTSAKVASPYSIHRRYDSMVIYLREADEAKAGMIARHLRAKFESEGSFEVGAPIGMKEMAPGIGYAELLPSKKSHSSNIAAAIESAIKRHDAHISWHGDRKGSPETLFRTTFLPEELARHGFDPEAPYKKVVVQSTSLSG